MAYILANNITKPIKILGGGMDRVANGELETRISQQVDDRDDELSHLAVQFDKMAEKLENLWPKSVICSTTFLMKCVRRWRACRQLSA